MPNIVIYINTSNYERFKQEHNKSGLVNDLIAEHYGFEPEKPFIQTIKNDEQRSALENRVESHSEGFCPNGHSIPTGRSKCMGKGCKYAH